MSKEYNPHQPTGHNTPGWVIWLLVFGFLALIVCGVEASKRGDESPEPTPTVSNN
jgi:hypothetical protein